MILAIFACKIREVIISVLTERAAPLRRSLNSADAEKKLHALISRRRGNTNKHRDSLKFVQEVTRFVTSRYAGSKKALNLAKLATLRASLLTSLSV